MIRFNRSRAGHPRHHLRVNASPSQWRRIWIFLNDSVFGDVSKICREFPILNRWYKSSLLGPHPQTSTHQPPPPCHTHNLKSLVFRPSVSHLPYLVSSLQSFIIPLQSSPLSPWGGWGWDGGWLPGGVKDDHPVGWRMIAKRRGGGEVWLHGGLGALLFKMKVLSNICFFGLLGQVS